MVHDFAGTVHELNGSLRETRHAPRPPSPVFCSSSLSLCAAAAALSTCTPAVACPAVPGAHSCRVCVHGRRRMCRMGEFFSLLAMVSLPADNLPKLQRRLADQLDPGAAGARALPLSLVNHCPARCLSHRFHWCSFHCLSTAVDLPLYFHCLSQGLGHGRVSLESRCRRLSRFGRPPHGSARQTSAYGALPPPPRPSQRSPPMARYCCCCCHCCYRRRCCCRRRHGRAQVRQRLSLPTSWPSRKVKLDLAALEPGRACRCGHTGRWAGRCADG